MTTQPEERDILCQSSQNTEEPGGQTSRALGSTGLGTAFSLRPFPHCSHARDPSRRFLPLQHPTCPGLELRQVPFSLEKHVTASEPASEPSTVTDQLNTSNKSARTASQSLSDPPILQPVGGDGEGRDGDSP